jgi:hypothetical protein
LKGKAAKVVRLGTSRSATPRIYSGLRRAESKADLDGTKRLLWLVRVVVWNCVDRMMKLKRRR